ncbi:hypothetical protein ACFYYB_34690 [Streptomyces sp. NPDC002886]|uniref:hypothetical protein n=1 Tax=Streptomyces sp. NPDC002886 TaxID=3364667 RepID=UPI003677F672
MSDKGPEADRDTQEQAPALPDKGSMVDEHGRPPGTPSRTGTGSTAPAAHPDRVERAAHDTESAVDRRRESP